MRQLSIAWISAQRRVRASLAISGPDRAYSVARAGRGRTEISSASATAERLRRDRAPTSEAQAAFSIHMTMRSFRTPLRLRSATHRRCLAGKPSSTFALSGTRLSTESAPQSDAGPGKSLATRRIGTRRHCLDRETDPISLHVSFGFISRREQRIRQTPLSARDPETNRPDGFRLERGFRTRRQSELATSGARDRVEARGMNSHSVLCLFQWCPCVRTRERAEAPDRRPKTKRTREFPLFQWVDFSWRAILRLMQGAPDADQKRGEEPIPGLGRTRPSPSAA
jgi:hypothetical protein